MGLAYTTKGPKLLDANLLRLHGYNEAPICTGSNVTPRASSAVQHKADAFFQLLTFGGARPMARAILGVAAMATMSRGYSRNSFTITALRNVLAFGLVWMVCFSHATLALSCAPMYSASFCRAAAVSTCGRSEQTSTPKLVRPAAD